jgi:hypothetical protein
MHSIRCPTPVRCAYPTACSRHPPTHHAPVTHQWYPLLARPAPPPPHSLPPSTAARPALPPPTAAHAAVRTRHRRHCSAVERNPPNRPVPGSGPAQQAFLFLGSQGLYVYSWPATLPAGWASLHPPTAISLPLPLPAANIVLDSSLRLESSIRVLDNRTMPPSSSQPPPTPSLASCVTQALQPGDLLQLSGEDQSTCPACGHLCPPSSPEAPWQGQSGSGQCSTAKQRNGTLHSWAFRQ